MLFFCSFIGACKAPARARRMVATAIAAIGLPMQFFLLNKQGCEHGGSKFANQNRLIAQVYAFYSIRYRADVKVTAWL